MKTLLSSEELVMFIASIVWFSCLPYHWWLFIVLILTPDISLIGYLYSNKIGAYCYNFVHHKGIALIIFLLSLIYKSEVANLISCILFAHSSMDRIFGYGLKYEKGFKYTHLGEIGNK